MPGIEHFNRQDKDYQGEKILLLLLPFWTPQIPPLGIVCLKTFLQEHGYKVKAVDANTEEELRVIYDKYIDLLSRCIPGDKKGNIRNIGMDVLYNQLMVHQNYKNEEEYIALVKVLVFQTFYFEIKPREVRALIGVIEEFYLKLEEYLADLLDKENPSLLGLSVYRDTLPASIFASKSVRKINPRIKIVMGGPVFAEFLDIGTPDFEYFWEKTNDYIDGIIIGEGELLFLKYLRGTLPGDRKVFGLKDIAGETLDLSSMEAPDFSDLDTAVYPYMASYTSRSCPFQCNFCSETLYWGKYRKRNINRIVKELWELYEKHGSQLFLMCDSLLNPVITDLAQAFIEADRSLYWDGYLRVAEEAGDVENARLWRKGGFYRARLGVESGSQRILESMGKKINIRQIKSTISALAHAGIKTTTYWIVGYPGETEEEFKQTLRLIEELNDDIYEADCNPFGYSLTGQVNSAGWAENNNPILLYPEGARDMLITQTWILDAEPSREETYQRVNKFIEHCDKLGIPNPYSLRDIYQADERWKKLHFNAVPAMTEFMQAKDGKTYIDECKKVKKIVFGKNIGFDNKGWGF